MRATVIIILSIALATPARAQFMSGQMSGMVGLGLMGGAGICPYPVVSNAGLSPEDQLQDYADRWEEQEYILNQMAQDIAGVLSSSMARYVVSFLEAKDSSGRSMSCSEYFNKKIDLGLFSGPEGVGCDVWTTYRCFGEGFDEINKSCADLVRLCPDRAKPAAVDQEQNNQQQSVPGVSDAKGIDGYPTTPARAGRFPASADPARQQTAAQNQNQNQNPTQGAVQKPVPPAVPAPAQSLIPIRQVVAQEEKAPKTKKKVRVRMAEKAKTLKMSERR